MKKHLKIQGKAVGLLSKKNTRRQKKSKKIGLLAAKTKRMK